MEKTKIILIGGSAGSIQVVISILESLPASFSIPIIIIIHRGNTDSELALLMQSYSQLQVQDANDKDEIKPGHVYIAPADYHLLLEQDGILSLDDSEKIHWSRPAIDPTFETAVDYAGKHTLAILLSGANHDGANGLKFIDDNGGRAIIQDPLEAEVDYMPLAAMAGVKGAEVLSTPEIINVLKTLM